MSEVVDSKDSITHPKKDLYVQIDPKTGWANISGKLFRDHFKNPDNEIDIAAKHMYHFFVAHFKPIGINFFSQILTPDYMAAMYEYDKNTYDRSFILKSLNDYISRDPIHAAKENIKNAQNQIAENDHKRSIDSIRADDLEPSVDKNFQYLSWFDVSEKLVRYHNIHNLRNIYETKGEEAAIIAVVDRLASIFRVGITLMKDLTTEERNNLLDTLKTMQNNFTNSDSVTNELKKLGQNYYQNIENIINQSNKERLIKK